MALFDGIPAAIQAFKDAIDDLPEDEQMAEAGRMLWEAILGHVFDDTDFGEGKVPVARGDKLEFEVLSHTSLTDRDALDQHPASAISYDNSVSGLAATTVQEAIDELAALHP